MTISVATAPVSWGIMEVEGWGGQQPFQSVLDEMQAAGYSGTELGPYGYFPTDPKQVEAELGGRGLRLVSAFVPVPLASSERHEAGLHEALKVAELLRAAGARLIVLADEMSRARMAVAGRADESRDGLNDDQWAAAAEVLTRVAEACRRMGLDTVFHHHAGTMVETPREVERLLASTDPDLIGLCLDTGHYYYGGGDPVEAVRKYGPRIRHLHLKDIRPAVLDAVRREEVNYIDAVRRDVFCELGEGAVDFPTVVGELTAQGFDGWAVVEQDTDASRPGVKPVESAIRSRRYLREVIGI